MIATAPPDHDRRDKAGDIVATAVEAAVVALAVGYVVTGALGVLLAWEVVAGVYILGGLGNVIRQAGTGRTSDRPGFLGPLSWILPLASSVAGVYSAVLALLAQSSASHGDEQGMLAVALAVIGIVLSWILLHLGMGQSYQSLRADPGGAARFDFPATETPVLLDFLYFSFAIGAAFATSDTRVLGRRIRLLVLLHSVVSFFYNAFVVAVAFQVLQQLIPLQR